jgi:hypothetical protein
LTILDEFKDSQIDSHKTIAQFLNSSQQIYCIIQEENIFNCNSTKIIKKKIPQKIKKTSLRASVNAVRRVAKDCSKWRHLLFKSSTFATIRLQNALDCASRTTSLASSLKRAHRTDSSCNSTSSICKGPGKDFMEIKFLIYFSIIHLIKNKKKLCLNKIKETY